jgi:hypothetical protein
MVELEDLASGWVPDEDEPDSGAGVLHPSTLHRMAGDGVTLFEPFGGLCAGLEMCLTMGVKVHKYWYCDINPDCQAVALHRLAELTARYPHLLGGEAWENATAWAHTC